MFDLFIAILIAVTLVSVVIIPILYCVHKAFEPYFKDYERRLVEFNKRKAEFEERRRSK